MLCIYCVKLWNTLCFLIVWFMHQLIFEIIGQRLLHMHQQTGEPLQSLNKYYSTLHSPLYSSLG